MKAKIYSEINKGVPLMLYKYACWGKIVMSRTFSNKAYNHIYDAWDEFSLKERDIEMERCLMAIEKTIFDEKPNFEEIQKWVKYYEDNFIDWKKVKNGRTNVC